MSNELTNAGKKLASGDIKGLTEAIFTSMRDALRMLGQLSATEFMIPTAKHSGRGRPTPKAPVDPVRLTWRTGALARSLTRTDDPANILRTYQADARTWVGVLGTRKAYAAIHELGGQTSPHEIKITEKMVRFFWAKHHEEAGGWEGDTMWKRLAIATKREVKPLVAIKHPGSKIHARPFLRPAAESGRVLDYTQKILGQRVTPIVARALRMAFSGGAS